MPLERSLDGLGVGVEQELGRIEAVAFLGRVRAMYAIAVREPRSRLGQVDMPRRDSCGRACGCGDALAGRSSGAKRQRSTAVACSLNSAKLTPAPSHVAPSGNGAPGRVRGDVTESPRA